MSRLESYLSRLSEPELIYVVYYLNFRSNKSFYRLERDFSISFLCPDSGRYESIITKDAKCKSCQQASNLRAITSAVNDYRRMLSSQQI